MKLDFTESTSVEFKETLPPGGINKSIIAFANTYGGDIYIGVADDSSVVGVEDADATCQQITNMARDAIDPDIMMFLDCHLENIADKTIIKIVVQKGTSRPYCLKSKGLSPAGVFVRQGTSSAQASREAIKRMIKEADGDIYEEEVSSSQNLTFNEASPIFSTKDFLLDDPLQRKLKLKNEKGLYTNLGLLLSDQCPHTVKVSVFRDSVGANVSSWKEFSGSLLRQNEEIYRFIDIHNDNAIVGIAKNLQRIERWSYFPDSIREALFNLLIHRDFAIRQSSQIKIYKNRIEFSSFGTLMEGISLEDIMAGTVAHRNRNLAELFRRLGHIEAFGFGIPKIMDLYKEELVKPQLKKTDTLFIIILPNINDARQQSTDGRSGEPPISGDETKTPLSEQELVIVRLFNSSEYITRKNVESSLSLSSAMAKRHLKRLVEKGVLLMDGASKNTKYYLTNEEKSD